MNNAKRIAAYRQRKKDAGLVELRNRFVMPEMIPAIDELITKLDQEYKMKTIYTIPAKMSNTGSIHDISDTSDRDIVFGPGCKYAVVLSSYYGGKGYTTHKTASAAIAKSKQLGKEGWSHKIIDTYGSVYNIVQKHWDDELIILDQ